MEQENKRARDESRREYNETIVVRILVLRLKYYITSSTLQALVQFVRKRDPRYKAHLAQRSAAVSQASRGRGLQNPKASSQGRRSYPVQNDAQEVYVSSIGASSDD